MAISKMETTSDDLREVREGMKVLYRCDPEKNKECNKRGCYGHTHFKCRCTSNREYAELDSNGNPIIAYIHFDDQPPLMIDGGTEW